MADNTNIYTLTLFYKRFLFIARDVCEHFYIKNKIKIISLRCLHIKTFLVLVKSHNGFLNISFLPKMQ